MNTHLPVSVQQPSVSICRSGVEPPLREFVVDLSQERLSCWLPSSERIETDDMGVEIHPAIALTRCQVVPFYVRRVDLGATPIALQQVEDFALMLFYTKPSKIKELGKANVNVRQSPARYTAPLNAYNNLAAITLNVECRTVFLGG